MRDILEIINKLQATPGRNDKEDILRGNKDNENLKQVLHFVFDPFTLTGVTSKTLHKLEGKKFDIRLPILQDLFTAMRFISKHNTGKNNDIFAIRNFINMETDEELREFYIQVLTKELKIGATSSTLNKIFNKGFINKFDCMLAKKFEDHQHKVEGKDFIITEKLDGMRILALVEGETVKFFSRQGKPVIGLIEIEESAKYLPDNVYDGELLVKNADDYKDRDVLQETLKIARKDGDKKNLIFNVFDAIPVDEFKDGKSKETFIIRKNRVIKYVEDLGSPFIQFVPDLYRGSDISVIPGMLDEMNTNGKEGLMLNLDSQYVGKRTDQLLKIKSMNEFDEKVVGYEEGEGKYKGKLGSLIVQYKGNTLHVGSGFTDEQRVSFWEYRDELIDRVITVQYFRESTNQNGGVSVSFPVFKMLRELSKEVSYN